MRHMLDEPATISRMLLAGTCACLVILVLVLSVHFAHAVIIS